MLPDETDVKKVMSVALSESSDTKRIVSIEDLTAQPSSQSQIQLQIPGTAQQQNGALKNQGLKEKEYKGKPDQQDDEKDSRKSSFPACDIFWSFHFALINSLNVFRSGVRATFRMALQTILPEANCLGSRLADEDHIFRQHT